MRSICRHYKVTPQELVSKSSLWRIRLPRIMHWKMLSDKGVSVQEIAMMYPNSSNMSIYKGIYRIEELIETDKWIRKDYECIINHKTFGK